MALVAAAYKLPPVEQRVIEFKGLNKKDLVEEGEMRDMLNLTAERYPLLCPRKPRGSIAVPAGATPISAITKYEKIAMICKVGNQYRFYYDSEYIPEISRLSAGTKMVAINTRICFFPQKLMFNAKTKEVSSMDATLTFPAMKVQLHQNGLVLRAKNGGTLPTLSDNFNLDDVVHCSVSSGGLIPIPDPVKIDMWNGGNKHTNIVAYNKANIRGAQIPAIGADPDFVVEDDPGAFLPYVVDNTFQARFTLTGKFAPFKAAGNSRTIKTVESEEASLIIGATDATITETKVVSTSIKKNGATASDGSTASAEVTVELKGGIPAFDGSITLKAGKIDTAYDVTIVVDVTMTLDNEFEQIDADRVLAEFNQITDVLKNLEEKDKSTTITFAKDDTLLPSIMGQEYLTVEVDNMTISRTSPDIDIVMESNNRLWGASNDDNTIYCCKLGDPTNWQYFQQTSVDSYYAEQGTDGDWTGCANYGAHLLFFKEDSITKLYGTAPSSYQTVTVTAPGVAKDSPKSIAVINDMVVYRSRNGIMAYDGSVPYEISQKFGDMVYSNVVGGTDGKNYYCTLDHSGPDGPAHRLLCLDIEKATWHQHDETGAECIFKYDGQACMITTDGNIEIIDAREPDEDQNLMTWIAVFGPFDEYVENRKVYSKMSLRATGKTNARIRVFISIDNDYDKIEHGEGWEEVADITFDGYGDGEYIPIVPRRCDKFSIKIEGTGMCEIKELTRRYRMGTGGKL